MLNAWECEEGSLYERVGGHATFVRLVRAFFAAVELDPELAPLFGRTGIDVVEPRYVMFLEQYWGGPPIFSQRRGAPALRRRHMSVKVTARAKVLWLAHMHDAITEARLGPAEELELREYIDRAAPFLINAD
ncbi:globin [Nigerium sp.]|uniref:globin domain-containing protein n=1 Tax=Nigerium sp. TaxID=2042655 RepID=UPI003221BF33